MRTIEVKLLPDGSGRVRIHWFCRSEAGKATAQHALTATGDENEPVKAGPVKGFIACQRQRTSLTPARVNGAIAPVFHTDDVRAATCPECLATEEARMELVEFGLLVSGPPALHKPERETGDRTWKQEKQERRWGGRTDMPDIPAKRE